MFNAVRFPPSHVVLFRTYLHDLTEAFATSCPPFRFGVALYRLAKKTPAGIKWDRILTIQLFEELMEVFMLFVLWIVQITPVAIISLIAKAIGSQSDLGEIMKSLGYMLAAIFLGLILQFAVVYCGLYLLFLKKNPLQYYKKAIPAFTMAFASSSSAATLPVTISCAVASGEVTEGIARFCLPLGATGEIQFLLVFSFVLQISLGVICQHHEPST